MAKNTKCLNCLSVFTNSYNLSYCGECGHDRAYLVEYETNTEKQPTRLEFAVAKITELEQKLANAENAIYELELKLQEGLIK